MLNLIRVISLLAAIASLTVGTFCIERPEPSIIGVALCAVVCILSGIVLSSTFFMTVDERR